MHCWLSLPGCKVRVALSPEAASARARELQPAACRPLWPRFFMLSHTCVSAGSVSLAEAWDHTFRRTFELRSLRISVVWDQQGLPVYNCSVVSDSSRPHGLQPARLLCPWNSLGKNTGMGFHFLFLVIFPTQGSNLGLLHCRQILYCLSHQGSSIIG